MTYLLPFLLAEEIPLRGGILAWRSGGVRWAPKSAKIGDMSTPTATPAATAAPTSKKIFADRINRIEVSATMAITANALALKAQGIDLADFGAGEPHFATPAHIKKAAIEAIENNF